jgi:hypothetical protein
MDFGGWRSLYWKQPGSRGVGDGRDELTDAVTKTTIREPQPALAGTNYETQP